MHTPHIIKQYINRGHERSVRAKKNILASIALKGINIALGFISLPLALRYLDPVQFGIFATLTSMIAWFSYFDIGLGQGLRNKFAEAIAIEDDKLARTYVSTTYYILGIIITLVFIIFLVVNHFLDWSKILNADIYLKHDLKILSIIVCAAFSLKFVFGLIYRIFYALQRPAMIDVFNVIGKILWIISIFILINISKNSLLYFGFINSFVFASIPILAGIYYYRFKYQKYSPSYKYVEFKYAKELTTLGIKFFIIQISLLVIQATNNILIAQFIGPASVTSYRIAFKYFSFVVMLFHIVRTPLWSAYTEAYKKNDLKWIKNTLKKMIKLWALLLLLVIFMLSISNFIYRIWIGESVKVPFLVSASVGLLMITNSWISIFHYFLNGVGKIKLQMYITIIAGVINIPLSIFFVKYFNLGAAGIVLGSIVSLMGSVIISPIQTRKILQNKAIGIWNK